MMRCFVYFLAGTKFTARFVVGLNELRRHHPMIPVVVLAADGEAKKIAERVIFPNVAVRPIQLASVRRNAMYLTKTTLHRSLQDCRECVFLDADTLILGDLDELWPGQNELVVTQFSDWVSNGRRMVERFERWRKICPDLVDRMVSGNSGAFPAINNGVLGFKPTAPILERWADLAAKMPSFICDETTLGLLWPDANEAKIVDDRFNWSPVYGKAASPRIIHYHGSKDRHADPKYGKEWIAAFRQMLNEYPDWHGWIKPLLLVSERKLL